MLKSICPIDGRYHSKTQELSEYFSEYALIKYRVFVEIEFLKYLLSQKQVGVLLKDSDIKKIDHIFTKFSEIDANEIKNIEKETNHDVKAVEYFLKRNIKEINKDIVEFVHFACTSEDINNLAYALMIKDGLNKVIIPSFKKLIQKIESLSVKWSDVSMLSRTHGQAASPTTVGKELKVFEIRFKRQLEQIIVQKYYGKLNGATGNFNAHVCAFPDIDWIKFSSSFIKKLGLEANLFTTQIEPHDFLAEVFDSWSRIGTILIDFNKDIWNYISLGFFNQKTKEGEIGSSTMPHKINPIDFENSEGNTGLAIAIFGHLARKLPISRMQRDLTDSTALRNMGLGFAYLLLSLKSTIIGLDKLSINNEKIKQDLSDNPEVLAEVIQVIMRKNGISNPYEKLKELTRGKRISMTEIKGFVSKLDLSKKDKELLMSLCPDTYVGLSGKIAKMKL